MSSTHVPKVYEPREWWSRFLKLAKNARRSIYIQSLTFEAGEMVDPLIPILIAAAQQGVKVILHIDWVAQLYVHGQIKLLPRLKSSDREYAAQIWQQNRKYIEQLRKAGVEVVFTNKFNWWQMGIKIAGRNHQKIYVIDEEIAWIGGVNLLDKNLQALDVMLELTASPQVKTAVEAFHAIDSSRFGHDVARPCSDMASILIDNGRRGESIIYDQALEVAAAATRSIIFVSQFIPEGKLRSELIAKARQGVQVTVYTSTIRDRKFHTLPYRPVYQTFLWDIKGVENVVFLHLPQSVHAKVIIADGKEVVVGSHNLVETGIKLGTQEIAYRSTEPALLSWFADWLNRLAKS